VIDDADLVAAISGRNHWRLTERAAVYSPPGAGGEVWVRPVQKPTRRERYLATIVVGGRATNATPWPTATSAVRWAERVRLA
jgi:hypothetical protein